MTEIEAYAIGFRAGGSMYDDPHGDYRCPLGTARETLRLSWQNGCREAMTIRLRAMRDDAEFARRNGFAP